MQTNVGGGNQNIDKNTEDDFEEEDDSDGFQRRILTQKMIDLPIFKFSSLVNDIIGFNETF